MANQQLMRDALDEAIEDALSKMDDDARDQFKAVCAAILAAYVNDDVHCLVLLGKTSLPAGTPFLPGLDVTHISSINASEIQAAQIIASASNQISSIVMADAPPRELFN